MGNGTKVALVALLILMVVVIARFVRDGSEEKDSPAVKAGAPGGAPAAGPAGTGPSGRTPATVGDAAKAKAPAARTPAAVPGAGPQVSSNVPNRPSSSPAGGTPPASREVTTGAEALGPATTTSPTTPPAPVTPIVRVLRGSQPEPGASPAPRDSVRGTFAPIVSPGTQPPPGGGTPARPEGGRPPAPIAEVPPARTQQPPLVAKAPGGPRLPDAAPPEPWTPPVPEKGSAPDAKGSGTGTFPLTHTVEKGDSFWSLAQRYYRSGALWAQIEKANPGVKLLPGKKLTIPAPVLPKTAGLAPSPGEPSASATRGEVATRPASTERGATARPAPAVQGATRRAAAGSGTADYQEYTVQKGDTLTLIAKRFYNDVTKFPLIEDANENLRYQTLQAGSRIRIPTEK
ncbi:MAG: LysM peptidoglycan-binding domain-containing protein [Planctomycetes bacterium]|nr:LysM peptidoglycan-binding domain-containing protein [Planctomycetota bacterium]